MKKIPLDILIPFNNLLIKKAIPQEVHHHYKKWLRYYLDFCNKYNHLFKNIDSLSLFKNKLQEKNQSLLQQEQAAQAISLFYDISPSNVKETKKIMPTNELTFKGEYADSREIKQKISVLKQKEKYVYKSANTSYKPSVARGPASTVNDANFRKWKAAYVDLYAEIKMRHYSRKTFKAYNQWIKKFHYFVKNKDPQLLTSTDVKEFLSSLAVKHNVSASTQNQAFNALLFFYRHIIKKDFGEHKDIVRAKHRPYIPVVLSKQEVYTIIEGLVYPYDLERV